MATVIDELTILFGLDGSKFSSQADKVDKDVQKLKEKSVKNMKQTEDGLAKLGKGVVEVQKLAMGLMTALVGATGLVQFTTQIINAESALSRLSDHTGEATQSLQAMGNIAELMGGKADEAFGSAQRFADEMARFKLMGEPGAMGLFATRMGVQPMDQMGRAREFSQVMLDLASAFEKGRMSKNEFYSMAKDAGFDSGTIDAMAKGRAELEKLFKQQEKLAKVTNEQAKAARELQRQFTEMKQSAKAWAYETFARVRPYIEEFLQNLQKVYDWLAQHKDFVIGALTALAVVLTATFLPALVSVIAAIAPILILAAAIGLLWDSYQTWKKGGKTFIDWDKWSAEINPAIKAVGELTSSLVKLFDSVNGREKLANVLQSIGMIIREEFSAALRTVTNLATALDLLSQRKFAQAAAVLYSTESNEKIRGMTSEQAWQSIRDNFTYMGIPEQFKKGWELWRAPWSDDNSGKKSFMASGGASSTPADIQAKQKYLRDLEVANKLPVGILDAVWYQESRRGRNAGKSRAGAEGDFQFMPNTAKRFGVNVKDFNSSANGAAKYLAVLSTRYNGDVAKMLAGYNAGEGNVDKYNGVPPFRETQNYVTQISRRMQREKGNIASSGFSGYPAGARAQAALGQGIGNKSVTNSTQVTVSGLNIYANTHDGAKLAMQFVNELNGIYTPLADTGMN